MRPIQEITEALAHKYTRTSYELAPIKTLRDGNDYISWNDSADLLNGLFGPMGWSSSIVSCTYREVDDGEKTHRGYEAVVRVTVGFIDNQGDNATTHRDGAGFAGAVPQGNKNPLDLAFKAAASDAFSRAVKQLGDHFGLFLYDKPADEAHTNQSPTITKDMRPTPTTTSGGGGKTWPVSSGRVPHLLKIGYTQAQVDGMSNAQATKFFDLHWTQKQSAEEAAVEAGMPPVPVKAARKDGIPIPQ